MDYLIVVPGLLAGCVIWYVWMRPFQLREHERKRRSLGLPPKYRLPEDDVSRRWLACRVRAVPAAYAVQWALIRLGDWWTSRGRWRWLGAAAHAAPSCCGRSRRQAPRARSTSR